MGTLTRDQFRAELVFDLRGRTDTADPLGFSTTRQDMFINAAYLHVTHPSVFRHRELQLRYSLALVANDFDYTFTPTGAGAVITALRSVSHCVSAADLLTDRRQKLLPQDMQWFESRTHSTGAPRNYGVIGDQIVVSPVPSVNEAGQILSVIALREPAVLAAAGDTTVLSTRWDEIVLLAARWRAELHLGYRDLAEATKLDFVGLINEYKDFDQLHGEDWDWSAELRTEGYMEVA